MFQSDLYLLSPELFLFALHTAQFREDPEQQSYAQAPFILAPLTPSLGEKQERTV
jgi:hypothetical protein